MQNTYLITGAACPAALTVTEYLAANKNSGKIIAQSCKNSQKLAPLAKQFKGKLQTFDVDLTDTAAQAMFLKTVAQLYGSPTHFLHFPVFENSTTDISAYKPSQFSADMQQTGIIFLVMQAFPSIVYNGNTLLFSSSENSVAATMANAALKQLADFAAHGTDAHKISFVDSSNISLNLLTEIL